MALMYPESFPHDLMRRPRLEGEALVYSALAAALDDRWLVFYDRGVRGTRRRVDFIALNADRGAFVCEVKGGQVHDKRGSFRQLVRRTPVWRKKIDPFRQLRQAMTEVWAVIGVAHDAVPVHEAIWFPQMSQAGLRWQPSPHILTRELLELQALRAAIETALPLRGGDAEQQVLRLISGLSDLRPRTLLSTDSRTK